MQGARAAFYHNRLPLNALDIHPDGDLLLTGGSGAGLFTLHL